MLHECAAARRPSLISSKTRPFDRSAARFGTACCKRRAIEPIQRTCEFPRPRAADRIPDRLSVPASDDQAIFAQQRQMLGYSRVANAQEFREFAHRALLLDQLADDDQAMTVRHRLRRPLASSAAAAIRETSTFILAYMRMFEYMVNTPWTGLASPGVQQEIIMNRYRAVLTLAGSMVLVRPALA